MDTGENQLTPTLLEIVSEEGMQVTLKVIGAFYSKVHLVTIYDSSQVIAVGKQLTRMLYNTELYQ